jgi:hypothetical protein
MDQDQQRDFAEEAYWRAFCPACGTSPCTADGGHPDDEPYWQTFSPEPAEPAAEFMCCGTWLPYPQPGREVSCPGCGTKFVSGLPPGWRERLSPEGVTHVIPPAGPCATCGRGRHDTDQDQETG